MTKILAKIRSAVDRAKALAAPYSKAIGAFVGPFVLALAVPLAKLDLPSGTDWKAAIGFGISGLVAAYFAPKNTEG